MKNNYFLPLLFLMVMQNIAIKAMDTAPLKLELYAGKEKGPMNSDWFYTWHEPYSIANKFHQKQDWKTAVRAHELYNNSIIMLLDLTVETDGRQERIILPGPEEKQYAEHMALLNLATCTMAQRKPSEHWASFDKLINITEQRCISKRMIEGNVLRDKIVRVRTDLIEMGDIFHFMETAHILKKRTGCYVIFSVRDFLKNTLMSAATAYDFGLVGEKEDRQPPCDYETHIVGLLGHLGLEPAQTAPDRIILTSTERAMVAVEQQISPLLAMGKKLAAVYVGEDCEATLIGGRKIKGGNLDPQAFKTLLRSYKDLVLIDLGGQGSSVIVDKDQQNQCIKIAVEEQAIDTPIALALLMNDNKNIVGFGPDTGVTNAFMRALSKAAQRRMALIIPNGGKQYGQYDVRMEGEGPTYTQMISNCRVYKCEDPSSQSYIIDQAYQDMVYQEPPMHHYIQ